MHVLLPQDGWLSRPFYAFPIQRWSLWIWRNSINDEVVFSFPEALSTKTVGQGSCIFPLTPAKSILSPPMDMWLWPAFCATIQASWARSTRTIHLRLEIFCCEYTLLPEDLISFLRSLLRLNRENKLSQAVCLRIIKMHLSGHEINMQSFMDMNWASGRMTLLGWSKTTATSTNFWGPCHHCTSWLNIVYDSNQGWELVVVDTTNDHIRWHNKE